MRERKPVEELYLPTFFYVALSATLSWVCLTRYAIPPLSLVLYIALGMLIWSFVEYLFHRFIFHTLVERAKKKTSSKVVLVYYNHELHHQAPKNIEDIITHIQFSIPIATVIGALVLAFTQDLATTLAILPGTFLGYLYYEWVHYACHYWKPKRHPFLWQFQNHASHHFKDDTKRFGVTNPLWDFVFGTR